MLFKERFYDMRITENELRRIIKSVISETSMDLGAQHVSVNHSSNVRRAEACCRMSRRALIQMCEKICARNQAMRGHCLDLCICAASGDVDGCCRCLDQICQCRHCMSICVECCGC